MKLETDGALKDLYPSVEEVVTLMDCHELHHREGPGQYSDQYRPVTIDVGNGESIHIEFQSLHNSGAIYAGARLFDEHSTPQEAHDAVADPERSMDMTVKFVLELLELAETDQ